MATIAAAVKKELKQVFPAIKFSVTTKRDDVRVEWEMTLGTAATKQAVKEICKRYETVEHHGSLIDDTASHSGTSIYYYPSYTQERENWAIAGVIEYNFADATWEPKCKRFVQADSKDHYHATKLYYSYVENGVASELVDEFGNEPSDKYWYYCAKELHPLEPESEQIEPQVETSIIPLNSEIAMQSQFVKFHGQVYSPVARGELLNSYTAYWYDLVIRKNQLVGVVIFGGKAWLSDDSTVDHELTYEDLETRANISSTFSQMVTDGYSFYRRQQSNGEAWHPSYYLMNNYYPGGFNYPLSGCALPSPLVPHDVEYFLPAEITLINQPQTSVKVITDEKWENEEARIETRLIEIERGLEYTKPEENHLRAELAALGQLPHTSTNKSCYYCHSDEYASVRNESYRCYVCNPETQPEQPQTKLECLPQSKPDTEPNWMELYQETVDALVYQCRYTEIQSYEEWLAIERKRMKDKQEEVALEAEIWELQQKLIQLQSEHLKRKSNSNQTNGAASQHRPNLSHTKSTKTTETMTTITVQKVKENQVILADGTLETYKPFTYTTQQAPIICLGFAVLINGKVSKCNQGLWNIFPRKLAAIKQAEFYKNQQLN